jgi:hypothetical protein
VSELGGGEGVEFAVEDHVIVVHVDDERLQ